MITGTTKIIGIVGSPIVQVKMPGFLNAELAKRGLDIALIPLDIGRNGIDAFATVLRNWNNLLGCIVTVPYKQAFIAHIEDLSERARRLQAVNVIRRNDDGTFAGDMMDGRGFISALGKNGFDAQGMRAAVFGLGGAGSAISDALCEAGVKALAVTDLDPPRLERVATMLTAAAPHTRVSRQIESLDNYDLIINATPSGMNGDTSMPLPAKAMQALRPETFVADVVTMPDVTPFLAAAKARGCRTQGGNDMARAQTEVLGSFVGAF